MLISSQKCDVFVPKIGNADFISGGALPLLPKKNAKHNNITDVCAYRTNRKQFCLKERIGSKMFGTKVSQRSINFGDIKKER